MENPFKKQLSFVTNFFKRTSGSVIGIDIGSSAIKVVQLGRKEGRAVLETYGQVELGPFAGQEAGRAVRLSDEKILEALKDVIRESKSTATKGAMAIPLSSSLISVIEIPAVAETELENIIPIEAKKYIPVATSEVVLDWLPIPRQKGPEVVGEGETSQNAPTPGEKMEVLIVAIHNETLSRFRDITKGVMIESQFFEVETFGDIRASVSDESSVTMVMDMGAASTKLNVVDMGIVRMSHVINRGSQDITLAISRSLNISVTEAEKIKREKGMATTNDVSEKQIGEIVSLTVGHILSEANSVIATYNSKHSKHVASIVLTGAGSALKGFEGYAKESIGLDVSVSNPFSKVIAPAIFENVLKEAGPSFSVALGVALRALQESP
jgi:type IV pilus assembly protein PilM